jgi:hypothetical protein
MALLYNAPAIAIMVVLAASSLALAMILISLARTAQRTETRPLEETPVLDERGA